MKYYNEGLIYYLFLCCGVNSIRKNGVLIIWSENSEFLMWIKRNNVWFFNKRREIFMYRRKVNFKMKFFLVGGRGYIYL